MFFLLLLLLDGLRFSKLRISGSFLREDFLLFLSILIYLLCSYLSIFVCVYRFPVILCKKLCLDFKLLFCGACNCIYFFLLLLLLFCRLISGGTMSHSIYNLLVHILFGFGHRSITSRRIRHIPRLSSKALGPLF